MTGARAHINGFEVQVQKNLPWLIGTANDTDLVAGCTIKERYEVFVRFDNVFNEYFYTDPGFPWRGRYFEIGLKADVLK